MTLVVICVMGLPASGKSTLCKILAGSPRLGNAVAALSANRTIVVEHICFDDYERHFRSTDNDNVGPHIFNPTHWRKARLAVKDKLESLRHNHQNVHSDMTVVLLDDNFYYKSMRKRFRPDAIIYLNTPIELCFLRNRTRDPPVPDHVIEQMALQLEVPEDAVDHPVLFVDLYPSEEIEALADRIMANSSFWARSIQPKSHSIPECMNQFTLRDQVLNSMETRLRKCVSEIASKNLLDKPMNSKISELKREIMRQFKHQYTTVDNHDCLFDIMDSQCDLFIREICSFKLSYIIRLFYYCKISFDYMKFVWRRQGTSHHGLTRFCVSGVNVHSRISSSCLFR